MRYKDIYLSFLDSDENIKKKEKIKKIEDKQGIYGFQNIDAERELTALLSESIFLNIDKGIMNQVFNTNDIFETYTFEDVFDNHSIINIDSTTFNTECKTMDINQYIEQYQQGVIPINVVQEQMKNNKNGTNI